MLFHAAGVVCIYAGFGLGLIGGLSLLRPLRGLGIPTRRRATGALAAGALLAIFGAALPAPEAKIDAPRTALDRFVPVYQFREHHEIFVDAPPERAFEAIRGVTAGEITLFRTLTAIRRFGRPGPEDILNAPEDQPILDVATQTGFQLLALEPAREIVVGTLVIAPPDLPPPAERTAGWFAAITEPGYALAVMNFRVAVEGTGTRTTTETRVFATDPWSRRRFAAYWRVIYPGSALIRRMWLRAIERRAEDGLELSSDDRPGAQTGGVESSGSLTDEGRSTR